jgi:flagellar biosynthesis GTPase FlhF
MTITDNEKLTVLKLLAGGRTAEFAAAAVNQDADTVTRLASNHGYPDREKLAWAADILERNLTEARRAAAVTTRTTVPRPGPGPATPPPARPAQGNPVADTTANLIARGKKSEKVRTKRLAEKAETALADLTAALKAEQDARRAAAAKAAEREQERATTAAERAQRKARIDALEREIRQLRAAEKATKRAVAAAAPIGVDPKVVRAWAATAGVECGSHGRVPQAVVDQYLTANPPSGA